MEKSRSKARAAGGKYKGSLARPIEIKSPLKNLEGSAPLFLHEQELMPKFAVKMAELAAFYGVNPSTREGLAWLVFKMAREHVPGFKLQRPTGRRRSWTDETRRELFSAVRRIKKDKDLSDEKAVQALTERGEKYQHVAFDTLWKQFKEARARERADEKAVEELLQSILKNATANAKAAVSGKE